MRTCKTALAIAISSFFTVQALPQCADIIVGTYDGTPVLGNANTPFSTNTGSNVRNGARYQYLYPAAELLAAGLCPGPITKVTFYALETDHLSTDTVPCIPWVACPDLKVDVRLGNSGLSDFGPYVEFQNTPLSVDWDVATASSEQLNTESPYAFLVQTGPIDFPLTGTGFNWTGGNLVLDISWQRAAPNGISPAVQLEEELPYTATKWVQVTSSFNPSHGNTYQDDPLTANATTGTTFNRPVTTFNSTLEEQPMEIGEKEEGSFQTSFDPATGEVVINRRGADQKECTVVCTDITGRTIAQAVFPSGTGTLRISLDQGYQGVVVVYAVRSDGSRLDLGRITSIR